MFEKNYCHDLHYGSDSVPATIKSYKYYYQSFLLGVSYTQNVDYGDKKAVNKNNYGVKMYRKVAAMIGQYYPEKVTEFADLIESPDQDLRVACAVCILSLMNTDTVCKERALKLIQEMAYCGSSFEKLVWTKWLNDHGYVKND